MGTFIGRTSFDNNSAQTALRNQEEGFFDPVLTHIPSYSYLDLSTTWDMTRHLQVRAGVNNALDKDPPFLPLGDVVSRISASGLNTYPTYDILGREFFIALRATF